MGMGSAPFLQKIQKPRVTPRPRCRRAWEWSYGPARRLWGRSLYPPQNDLVDGDRQKDQDVVTDTLKHRVGTHL
jgi:hypothetical protein